MTLEPGTRFGSYEVVESIGAGGMGEVWRARDTSLKRDVALKILPQAFVDDADRIARFRREAEILAALNHANIATIHGLEQAGDQTAIVMELVEGPTLADRIREGPIRSDEAMSIALQVLAALEAAHNKGIVHRDLKPANVKVRDDGTVKVLDFGISKPIDASVISGGSPVMTTPAVTETGVILGTAAYMSPEQARGKFVDQRTDIWAFGCLLFEMLTGQPAFGGDDVMAILARVIDRDTDLTSIPGTVSPSVRHTIQLCLQKDPAKRIADIRDVRLALQGTFEAELPADSRAAPRRSVALPAALAIAALAAAAVMLVMLNAPLNRSAPEIRRSSYLIPEDLNLVQPTIPFIAVSADGRQIAFSTSEGIYRRDLSALEAGLIPGTEGEQPVVPVFSPDGRSILYRSNLSREIKRIGIEGGTPEPLLEAAAAEGGWRWDLDAAITFADENSIGQLSPVGGEPIELFTETGFDHIEPSWLPGGERLLSERRDPDTSASEIVVHTIASGETTLLFPGKQPTYIDPGYLVYVDPRLGLVARTFDAGTLAVGNPVPFIQDVLHMSLGGGAQYRLSASGTLIYVRGSVQAGAEGRTLAIADSSGIVEALEVPANTYVAPRVSPDGRQLALQIGRGSDAQIFVYDLAGGSEMRQLTFEGTNATPGWSPDGQWIAFASDRDGKMRIYRKRADGRGVAEPLTDPAEGRAHILPVWAPDGQQLTFTEGGGNDDADIWIVSPPDGAPEPLVGGAGVQAGLDFAPNGEAFAYFSITDGAFDVWVEPFPPDGSRTRVSEGSGPNFFPVFSSDGTELWYQGQIGLTSVEFDTTSLTISNRRQPLNFLGDPSQPWVDAIPDTDRMIVSLPPLIVGDRADERTEIVIVENWIEEVKQRLPVDE
jgi:Tol biopolymer transport system component